MGDEPFTIRPLVREDREWVARFLDEHWRSTQIVTRGRVMYGHLLPGFVAERCITPDDADSTTGDDDATEDNPIVTTEKIGLLTYNLEDSACEIVSLNSNVPGIGIGTALVNELLSAAKETTVSRIWLITTNDNLSALHFWQKRGFQLVCIHQNAIEQARRLKPQIPIVGLEGIPIRDEIELEMTFT